jgi:serine/threonine protein phosphatase PrpC
METETLPARMIRVDAYGLSHAGKVRTVNEDHFAIMTLQKAVQLRATNLQDTTLLDRLRKPQVDIFVVADGVGGWRRRKIASGVAVKAVVEYLAEGRWVLSRTSTSIARTRSSSISRRRSSADTTGSRRCSRLRAAPQRP